MSVISSNMPTTPVLSSPNMGAAVVRSGNQPQSSPPVSAGQVQSSASGKGQEVSLQQVQQAVAQANRQLAGSNESITFGYEERLGQFVVQISDKATGQVIQQLPSKDFIQFQLHMREMIGLFLDKKA